jgi:hypothetical protein
MTFTGPYGPVVRLSANKSEQGSSTRARTGAAWKS